MITGSYNTKAGFGRLTPTRDLEIGVSLVMGRLQIQVASIARNVQRPLLEKPQVPRRSPLPLQQLKT